MNVQFLVLKDPTIFYFETGEVVSLVQAFVVATDRYVEDTPVFLTSLGETSDAIANYARVGTLFEASIAAFPETEKHKILKTLNSALRDSYPGYEAIPLFFLGDVTIGIPFISDEEYTPPTPILSETVDSVEYLGGDRS